MRDWRKDLLRRGERVYADGEIVFSNEVVDHEPSLCVSVGHDEPCEHHPVSAEGRLDREHVEKLRDALTAWLELVEMVR